MSGEDPEDVLPAQAKTWHFFRCIVEPDDPNPVVIDRHAHDVAVGEKRDRGLDSKGRYATLALAYRLAARQLDLIPSVCQATAWVTRIERTR